MPTPLLVLFYVWLVASVVILGYRLVSRRGRQAPKPVKAADLTPAATPPPAASPPTASPIPAPAPAPDDRPTEPAAATPAPTRTPAAAPAPTGPRPPATTMMEALAGIRLPCDLLPMTNLEGRTLGAHELVLVTNGFTAAEVGRALGAAIAELGYSVTPLGSSRALAERGPDHITLTIHDRPDTVLVGTRPAFPSAGAASVVVELRL